MVTYVYKRLHLIIPLSLILTFTSFQINHLRPNNGLNATYFETNQIGISKLSRTENIAILSHNDHVGLSNNYIEITWNGYIWSRATTTKTLILTNDIQTKLWINQNPIKLKSIDTTIPKTVPISLHKGLNQIELHMYTNNFKSNKFNVGLKWKTLFGNSFVPNFYLFPEKINTSEVTYAVLLGIIQIVLMYLTLTLILLSTIVIVVRTTIKYHKSEIIYLTTIFLLSIAIRYLVLQDLRNNTDFDVLPIGSDQLVYISDARDFARGIWPTDTDFYRQPGYTWLLGNIITFISEHLIIIQLIQIVSGSITTFGVYWLSKSIFNKPTAYWSTLIWTIFSPLIFYEIQLLTHALEAHLTIWILCSWWSTHKSNKITLKSYQWILCPLLIGAASTIRPIYLLLLPIFLYTTIKYRTPQNSSLDSYKIVIILTSIALIPIIPITHHNYKHSGVLQLFSANGPITLYLGNNRDASGIGQYTPAFLATHENVNRGTTTFTEQTAKDIINNPLRWAGLMVRKSALFWGNNEIPNNVDFYNDGLDVSNILRIMPLRFGFLSTFGLTGILLTLIQPHSNKNGIVIIISTVFLLFITTITFHVVSRFRVPIYGPLSIFASFAISTNLSQLKHKQYAEFFKTMPYLAASTAFIFTMPFIANNSVPNPTTKHLPPNITTSSTSIGNNLILEGHEYKTSIKPGEPTFISLYWSINDTITDDYYGSIQIFNKQGQKISQTDQLLGGASFPYYTTSKWRKNLIIQDDYLITIPKDIKSPLGVDVLLVVYNKNTNTRLGEAQLTDFGITKMDTPDISNIMPSNIIIGPIQLLGYKHNYQNNILELDLYWKTLQTSQVDGTIFIHFFDNDNNFISGHDSEPRNGTYPTHLWQPEEIVVDSHNISTNHLNNEHYKIHIGMYDPNTQVRLSITNTNHNKIKNNSYNLFNLEVIH